jgi:exonuclease VII small subunit
VVRPPAGAVLDRAQSASDEEFSAAGAATTTTTTTTTKGRKHRHRRCNSLQDARSRQQIDARRAHESNLREGSGGAGSTVSLGKEATREEVESYVTRLESDIRQLETKLDDFNNRKRNSAQGWVGLEEKRNRKKLVDEMSRTLAARRKRLQAVYKRLQAFSAAASPPPPPPCAVFSSNKWCPSSDDDDTASPANITKELFDACLKPYASPLPSIWRVY